MSPGFGEIAAPRVEAVPPNQEAVRRGIRLEQRRDGRRRGVPILRVRDDRQRLAVLMRLHGAQALQHLVAFEGQRAVRTRGKNRAPNRVRMQHGAGAGGSRDRHVNGRLRRRFPAAATDGALRIDLDDVARLQQALVHPTRRDRQRERCTLDDSAEITAGAQGPAPRAREAADFGELGGECGESVGGSHARKLHPLHRPSPTFTNLYHCFSSNATGNRARRSATRTSPPCAASVKTTSASWAASAAKVSGAAMPGNYTTFTNLHQPSPTFITAFLATPPETVMKVGEGG